jgi:hypothetical protein
VPGTHKGLEGKSLNSEQLSGIINIIPDLKFDPDLVLIA